MILLNSCPQLLNTTNATLVYTETLKTIYVSSICKDNTITSRKTSRSKALIDASVFITYFPTSVEIIEKACISFRPSKVEGRRRLFCLHASTSLNMKVP
jgi:hypothetical protein